MKTLIEKLNVTCKKALESSAALCVSKGQYNVELEHYLARLIEQDHADIVHILRHFEIDINTVLKQLNGAIDRLPNGNTSTPALSVHLIKLLEQSWSDASLGFKLRRIRSASILNTLITQDSLRGIVLEIAPLLLRISRSDLKSYIDEVLEKLPEHIEDVDTSSSQIEEALSTLSPHSTKALNQFTTDLTLLAQENKLDPLFGRENEIQQIMEVLCRRQQNNPILVGDAGVGKTAIVEGIAQRIVQGEVPPLLINTKILRLDLAEIQAGTAMRGEFEDRLRRILQEIQEFPTPIILFIDEAHCFFGQSGGGSGLDSANLLKPALARGEIRTISSTTWPEYKKYFEKDSALTRRFSLIKINEPSHEEAQKMLRLVADKLERHHKVPILNEAIETAVSLTRQFIPERKLPDKALSLLDVSCSFVAISQSSSPEAIQQKKNALKLLEIEKSALEKDFSLQELKPKEQERIKEIQDSLLVTEADLKRIENQWDQQKSLLETIRRNQNEVGQNETDSTVDKTLLKQQLDQARAQYTSIPFQERYIHPFVNNDVVTHILGQWTGIPQSTLLAKVELNQREKIQAKLHQSLVGQEGALNIIAQRLANYNAGLSDESKPIGVFVLAGPSGVGKTETALVLADLLSGSRSKLVQLNMNEFQESHAIATLKGAPPGYAGYGKGGTLTEAVRRNPYSVILLDEFDKAHPDVLKMFYQVFDKGVLEDSDGLEINFTNALFILTTNLGDEIITQRIREIKETDDRDILYSQLADKVGSQLGEHFTPAFLARVEVLPYFPLNEKEVEYIIDLKLQKIIDKVRDKHHFDVSFPITLKKEMVLEIVRSPSGIRQLDIRLSREVLPLVAQKILEHREMGVPQTQTIK